MDTSVRKNVSVETYRIAGLLAVVSAFLMVEGVTRTNLLVNTPSDAWGGDYRNFPPAVLFSGAVVEVLFALTGLAVGLAQLAFDLGSPAATIFTLICQLLGWYTFVVWTMAAPGYAEARATAPLWEGLTVEQSRAITAMGILGSIGVCFTLQGSQFYLAFKLLKLQQGQGSIYTAEYHRSRLAIFNFAVLLTGGSAIGAGVILRSALGAGRYAAPVLSPPFLVFYPELTITAGVVVTLYGLALVLVIFKILPNSRATALGIAAFAAFAYLCQVAFLNLGQGFGGLMLVIVGAQLTGLTFIVVFFPAYLVVMLCSEPVSYDPVVPEGKV